MLKNKKIIFLGVFLVAAISIMGWLLFKCQSKPTSTTQNGIQVVNNCDTIYQYISIPNPKMTFSNTKNEISKYGMGVSLGYDFNFIKMRGGLNYGLNFRYQKFIVGGYYNNTWNHFGVRFGFQFDK